jgi:tRNA 2-thiocytidine biosynthesis protein TtcA
MPAKLVSDDGKHIVIRPLAYCTEKDIQRYSEAAQFPIIPCNLCGSQENLQRNAVKSMLEEWGRRFPGRIESMFRAMQNITPSHMLDRELFDFDEIKKTDAPVENGDTAFDKEDFSTPETTTDVQVVTLIEPTLEENV